MGNEQNNIDNDEVSRLLGGLKRVDAPGDFDFHVRARVAAGRPAVRSAWLPMSARVAAPVALALLVAAYFGLRSDTSADVNQASLAPIPAVEQPAPAQPQAPPITESVPSANDRAGSEIALRPETIDEGKPDSKAVEPVRHKSTRENKTGGSLDITLGISKPRGPRASTKESLSAIGIEADPSGAVSEVKQNSVAERSGLKPGDVIVKVTPGNIRVRRNGQVVLINLKP